MICDRCLVDKTVTVAVTFPITRINSRTGAEKRETVSRRLCCACGGGEPEPAELLERPAIADDDELGHEQLEMGAPAR